MVSARILNVLEPALSPTHRKWPQLLIDTKNCNYQRLENVVIPAIKCEYQAPEISEIPQYHITSHV
jgi:hypothetical protein